MQPHLYLCLHEHAYLPLVWTIQTVKQRQQNEAFCANKVFFFFSYKLDEVLRFYF